MYELNENGKKSGNREAFVACFLVVCSSFCICLLCLLCTFLRKQWMSSVSVSVCACLIWPSQSICILLLINHQKHYSESTLLSECATFYLKFINFLSNYHRLCLKCSLVCLHCNAWERCWKCNSTICNPDFIRLIDLCSLDNLVVGNSFSPSVVFVAISSA